MTNAALIAKLESAKEGSRALSDEVLEALGYKVMREWNGWRWLKPGGNRVQTFDPTRNLQDAVDLVPEGTSWSVEFERENSFPHLEGRGWTETTRYMGVLENRVEPQFPYEEFGATPALALVIAILKAVEAKDG